MDSDRNNACDNRDRNRPADNLPNRGTLRNHADGFLAREFLVLADDGGDAFHVAGPDDGDNFLAFGSLDLTLPLAYGIMQ